MATGDQQTKELVDLLLDVPADANRHGYYNNVQTVNDATGYHSVNQGNPEYARFAETQQYIYSSELTANGIGSQLDSRDREWAEYVSFMKLSGQVDGSAQLNPMAMQYLAPSEGYNQDEANFVQNFAVQQQPFIPYPAYLAGFQQPFSSQLYSQFAGQLYPFGQPFTDVQQQYVGPDGQQAYFPIPPVQPEAYQTDALDPHMQLYQSVGNAMASMSIQDQSVPEQNAIQQQQQPQQPKPKKPEGPRSWADVLSAPAPKPASAPLPARKSQTPAATVLAPATTTAPPTAPKAKAIDTKPEQRVRQEIKPAGSQKKYAPPYDHINPSTFDCNPTYARFFVIKSYSEDDIHKAIKYNIWASTDSGNRRLDQAYRESSAHGPIYLFFSVNASGQFCGMAQMTSPLDYGKKCDLWAQDKWNGQFTVRWIFIKDIPNHQFRHIRLTNNDNKPVTNSRDTQEVLLEPGKEMLRIFTTYHAKTSILDDFEFYDKRQEELQEKKYQEVEKPEDGKNEVVELLPVATGENRHKKNFGKPGANQTQTAASRGSPPASTSPLSPNIIGPLSPLSTGPATVSGSASKHNANAQANGSGKLNSTQQQPRGGGAGGQKGGKK